VIFNSEEEIPLPEKGNIRGFTGTMSERRLDGSSTAGEIEVTRPSDVILNGKIRKLKSAISQMLLVNRRLQDEQIRYERATQSSGALQYSYNSRIRMCIYHGLRDMYNEYAHKVGEEINILNNNRSIDSGSITVRGDDT